MRLNGAMRTAGAVLSAALVYAAAVPWIYRPWFTASDALPHALGPMGPFADADLLLNVWILAWIAHAAVTDPGRLLDGNIFHPALGTIVGSENMLAHLPVTAPVLALTGSAVTMLKAYVLESIVTTGLGMFLYVRHHTRSWSAALLAGALLTWTPFRTETVPQPQYLGLGFFPIALLAVDLHLETGRRRWLGLLGAALVLQALACVYLGFFSFLLIPCYALARLAAAERDRLAAALRLAATGLAAGLALVPAVLPYLRGLGQGMIAAYDLALMERASWQPALYFSEQFLWRAGPIAVAVVAVDLARRAAARLGLFDRTFRGGGLRTPEGALWILAGAAAVLAAGPTLLLPGDVRVPLPYAALHDLVPGFSSLRVPIRFVIVVTTALAGVAGFAFARATRGFGSGPRAAVALALSAVTAWAAAPAPAPVMAAGLSGPDAEVYRWLADREGPGAVLEIPAQITQQDAFANLRNGRFMVASTLHWRPLLNGYTAYPPPSAGFYAAAIRELPAEAALANLVDTSDLRWVVVHRDELDPRAAERWAGPLPGLELTARFGSDEVYEVRLPRRRAWRSEVAERTAAPAADTLEGTPTTPLPEACRRGRILELDAPAELNPIPYARRVAVRFRNDSECAWPAAGLRSEGLVGLDYRWISPGGAVEPRFDPLAQLLADVPPHSEADASVAVQPPRGELGRWTLEVLLRQEGVPTPIATARRAVEIRPARGERG